MAFEPQKLLAGAVLYGCFVLLPTAGLLLADQGLTSPVWERLAVGLMGVFAGKLVWNGIKGPSLTGDDGPQLFWGPRWGFLAFGAALLVVAWFTNLPHALAGQLEGGFIVFKGKEIVSLDNIWVRIMTMAITALGVLMVVKGMRSEVPYRERRAAAAQRKEEKRMAAQAYLNGQDA